MVYDVETQGWIPVNVVSILGIYTGWGAKESPRKKGMTGDWGEEEEEKEEGEEGPQGQRDIATVLFLAMQSLKGEPRHYAEPVVHGPLPSTLLPPHGPPTCHPLSSLPFNSLGFLRTNLLSHFFFFFQHQLAYSFYPYPFFFSYTLWIIDFFNIYWHKKCEIIIWKQNAWMSLMLKSAKKTSTFYLKKKKKERINKKGHEDCNFFFLMNRIS